MIIIELWRKKEKNPDMIFTVMDYTTFSNLQQVKTSEWREILFSKWSPVMFRYL